MVIAGSNQRPNDHHRNINAATTTITTASSAAGAGGGGGGVNISHQQQQQQQQQQNNHNNNNNNNTIIAATAAPSTALEHFNVTSLGELSNVQLSSINAQLVGGTVTADGSFVTMGGVVVGRIHPAAIQTNGHTLHQQLRATAQPATREELQQLGVIKVESPATEFTNEG